MKVIINILLILSIIILGFILYTYNKLVKLENRVKETESGIDVLLKQRFDLIPNLVEIVKGYAHHEKSTFEGITKMRSNYEQHKDFNVQKIDEMNTEFNRLLAVVEAYPDLKANTQFSQLLVHLTSIENEIELARTRYNRAVTNYNNKVEIVPSNLIAKIFFFERKELFKITNEEKENVKINL